jgi:hypothetical protein
MRQDAALTELLVLIEAAFDGVPRTAVALEQLSITDRDGMSGDFDHRAYSVAGRHRPDRRWQDITAGQIETNGFLFGHMTPEDFRYFLPAYLCHDLRRHEVEEMVRVLMPRPPEVHLAYFHNSQYLELNEAQREAIHAFLTYVAEYCDPWRELNLPPQYGFWPDMPRALEYWSQPSSTGIVIAPPSRARARQTPGD